MKRISLSLAVISAMAVLTTASAEDFKDASDSSQLENPSSSARTLTQALQNGKVSGDVSVTYEERHQDKEISTYYQDTAYSVGSFGLQYETASFYNFSANVGVRAYKTLWQDDKNSTTLHGTGDASERFYEDGKNRTVDLETAYIAYDLNDIHVKAGRQPIYTDWMNKTHDAVRVDAKVADKTNVELIWSSQQGRVYARDYRPVKQFNPGNGGAYKFAITQGLGDMIKVTGYGFIAPDNQDIYGGKILFDNKVSNVNYGGYVHYADQNREKTSLTPEVDSSLFEAKAYMGIAGYTTTLGYVKIDDDEAFSYIAGEIVNPFEEGDQLYVRGAETYYAQLSKSFGDLSLTALYGYTEYNKDKTDKTNYDKDEFTLWAGYKFTTNTALNIGYTITNEDTKDTSTTDLNQFNATFVYSF